MTHDIHNVTDEDINTHYPGVVLVNPHSVIRLTNITATNSNLIEMYERHN